MFLIMLTEPESVTCYNALNNCSVNLQACRSLLQDRVVSDSIEDELRIIINIQEKIRNVMEFGNQKGDVPLGK